MNKNINYNRYSSNFYSIGNYKHRIKNPVCLKVFQVNNDNKILDRDFNETRNYPTRYTK